ncbi:energy-coupling factor transport system ATP-binding protein [Pilibacter termitis]|uniref:Energy-coupling factor transport system ATP-binding protein n=1 Tax=Pilibacter termitis TaxID=263852 RepID=A0A1T4LX97_9ENTE|nr:ABC transporter ATP-binding protein [Pilibacter termitis]SJZ59261.1 energy-coupling factor transport system ATP-binding protein [Pilibacter termitis]
MIVSLKNISYRYPLEKESVIHNVSFSFEKGKVYGMLGENEAGKTSICNIIRGFIPNFFQGELTGEVFIKGKAISEYTVGELSSIVGYSFQNPFTQISGVKETVEEELAYGMENLGVSPEKMRRKVDELIELFHLQPLVNKNPYELSGGQKQRVALASMLSLEPEVVILDEPTSQLDPKSTEDIFEIVQILKEQGKTILLVEHKVDLLAQYCDEIFVMQKGEIKFSGKTEDVLTNPEILQFGGQLPQATLFCLKMQERGKQFAKLPLSVDEAVSVLRNGGLA